MRQLEESDATQDYCNWLNDPEVNKYLETREADISGLKDYIAKQLSNPNSFFVGIFDKASGKHIGNLKLEPIDWENKKAIIGILIGDKNFWGKGISGEAIKLAVAYAFYDLGLNEIILGVIANNVPAVKSFEKTGFKAYSIEKNSIKHGEKLFDKIMMRIKK